jgi:hypothetical protein
LSRDKNAAVNRRRNGGRGRRPSRRDIAILVMLALNAAVPHAQPGEQVQDEYAVYELLAPDSASFRTIYEVSVTTPGAKSFFDGLGSGLSFADGRGDGVIDVMTGAPLKFARESNGLRVELARPVPSGGGQARLRITTTYRDSKSYRRDGNEIVFERAIPIRRAAFVLPVGYALVACNVPGQIAAEPDGRIRVSFMHQAPGPAALVLRAASGAPSGDAAKPRPLTDARSWEAPPSQGPPERARLAERAHQDRDIVYFLQDPSTNAFSLYHDYTESREGVDKYLNVVRPGSTVSRPSAKILDTGEALTGEIVTGAQLKAAGIDAGADEIAADQQVVVTTFAPVKKGHSIRLRLAETYTAPQSYRLEGDELVFERSLGRPRNSVVLPRGWYLTALSIPAVVRQTPDGTRVDFVNGRPDAIDVLMKGKRLVVRR